jgi:glycosyltransferase 2 family protein
MKKWIIVAAGLVISAVFLFLAFRGLNPQEVWRNLSGVNPLLLVVAAIWYFLGVALISLRWQFLLRAIQSVHLRVVMPLVCIGYMGNNVYPFRSGEVLRIFLLQREAGIPVARAATTVIIERVFDGIVMLSFIFVALLFVDVGANTEIRRILTFATPLFVIAVIIFFVLAARPAWLRRLVRLVTKPLPNKLQHIISHLSEEIIHGLEGLRSPADLAGAVFSSYASWMIEASVYWLVAVAFQLEISYAVALLIVGVVNLAGLIPASPGQFGVYEFFVSLVLVAATAGRIPESQALAYALVIHMVIWLPVTLVGFAFLAREGLGWKSITQARELENQRAAG